MCVKVSFKLGGKPQDTKGEPRDEGEKPGAGAAEGDKLISRTAALEPRRRPAFCRPGSDAGAALGPRRGLPAPLRAGIGREGNLKSKSLEGLPQPDAALPLGSLSSGMPCAGGSACVTEAQPFTVVPHDRAGIAEGKPGAGSEDEKCSLQQGQQELGKVTCAPAEVPAGDPEIGSSTLSTQPAGGKVPVG